jgi:hypothetical protein
MPFLRRLRATAVLAALWAACWALVGLLLTAGSDLWYYSSSDVVFHAVSVVAVWTGWGAISGAAFAVLLAAMEGRQNASTLRGWRVALWGACGGLVPPFVFLVLTRFTFTVQGLAIVGAVGSGVGAGCATLTLRIARASSDPRAAASP